MKRKGNVGAGERDGLSMHDLILSVFRKKFGNIIIGVDLLNLAHECWATVAVKDKNPKMERRA
jgi:hypothetical protein